MLRAVEEHTAHAAALIMAAAVADYRPETSRSHKAKRTGEPLTITLVENEDVLRKIPRTLIKVGFAAETDNVLTNAEKKLASKNADLIVANDVSRPDSGFGADTNRVVILSKHNPPEPLPVLPKTEVAAAILERVVALVQTRSSS